MTNPTTSSQSQRSVSLRFLKWLFTWRTQRRILIGFAWLATLIGLFYAVEDWRGSRAWRKYRAELEARGTKLDFKAYIPPQIPDDRNFASTPLVQSWFAESRRKKAAEAAAKPVQLEFPVDVYDRVSSEIHSPKKAEQNRRQFTDLVAWGEAFAAVQSGKPEPPGGYNTEARDAESRRRAAPLVLAGLQTNEADFAELRTALRRPGARYPIDYTLDNPWAILLPHLKHIKDTCQRLSLKAAAELAAGQAEQAFADITLGLDLADTLKREPIIISYLVRIGAVEMAIRPLWEGLAEHRWSDKQLESLQARLQQYDFFADLKLPVESEQAAVLLTVDLFRHRGSLGGNGDLGTPNSWVMHLIPGGWFDFEQLNYCRLLHEGFDPIFESQGKINARQIEASAREQVTELSGTGFERWIHHRVIATLMLPALGRLAQKSSIAQTTVMQAATACALERYRLTNGQFPETLSSLVPRFMAQLPSDLFTGEPHKYRRSADGQFVLYSVGWNGSDDGGTPGKVLFDDHQGDWVWDYPAGT
jgi:hypothetical protein